MKGYGSQCWVNATVFAASHRPKVAVWATMNFVEPMVRVTASANFWLRVFGSLTVAGASGDALSPLAIAEKAGLTRFNLSSPINPVQSFIIIIYFNHCTGS